MWYNCTMNERRSIQLDMSPTGTGSLWHYATVKPNTREGFTD